MYDPVGMEPARKVLDGVRFCTDAYEAAASYGRIFATLASGRQAWVYLHVPRRPSAAMP